MKPHVWVVIAALPLACAPSASPELMPTSSRFDTETEATAELVASMPDTIPCDSAVFVRASGSRQGVAAERSWLARFYPGHSWYGQALLRRGKRSYDRLNFARSDGRPASVCFDITMFFGRSF